MKSEKLENIAVALAAMVSAVLTGALTLSFGWLMMGLAMQLLSPVAFAQTKPAVQLEAAITKEQVDGDLQTAIADYRKIAADQSASRDVRANALLHLAGCYEKLGQQARNVYQQIVRDFADQPAAAQARARLAALRQDDRPAAPATMTQRKIEAPGTQVGPGDTDGHRVVYLRDATGELIYGDLAGKSKRVIFKAKPDDVWGWFPSRDFSIVGLEFLSKPGQPYTLAVVNTDGTGYREVFKREGRPVCGPDWSWDNRYFLCSQIHDGTSRLLRISVADGNIRELLSLKTGEIGAAAFSPDGRFVAYQVHPPADADGVTRIFVEHADGRDPHPVYEERPTAGTSRSLRLLDWTADGRYLAISSERTGNPALHLLPIKDGKSAGDPIFLRYGAFSSGVTTAAGNLIYTSVKPGGNWAVYLASLDSNSRVDVWKRLDLRLGNTTNPLPSWSGDSNQIVYVGSNEDLGQTGGAVVHTHNLSTGKDREIYHAPNHGFCIWAASQPKLFCSENSGEIYSIAVDTGEVAPLHKFKASSQYIQTPSRDDRSLYLFTSDDQAWKLLRWEIATGRETTLAQGSSPLTSWLLVSPDERSLIRASRHGIDMRPTSGGDWKPVAGALADRKSNHRFGVTPDGNWLLYDDADSAGKPSLFRVSTAGGKPERLGDFPDILAGSLKISPDGRKVIATGMIATGEELWSLENFVPAPPKP